MRSLPDSVALGRRLPLNLSRWDARLIATAKGLSDGAIPMGAVLVSRKIYDALMRGAESQIKLLYD